jgi:hypothetical protein
MEDGRRRLAYVNGGLQERPRFKGGRLTFKHRHLVLKRRRPMVGAGVHGSRRAVQSRAATIQQPRAAPMGKRIVFFFFQEKRFDPPDRFSAGLLG